MSELSNLLVQYLQQLKKRGRIQIRLLPQSRSLLGLSNSPAVKNQKDTSKQETNASLSSIVPNKNPILERKIMAPSSQPNMIPPVQFELTAKGKKAQWAELRQIALACTHLEHLARARTQVVFGIGSLHAELMFIGEAPGADEDKQGEPFVGRAGQLLTKMIETMGLKREQVYISNILKCRPDMPRGVPGNRKPTLQEMKACSPYLYKEVELISPKVIVALGATAVEGLLGVKIPMNQIRGKWQEFKGVPVMPTFHPSYLLRNASITEKRKVWEDLLMVMERLQMPINERQRTYFLPATRSK